MNIQSQLKLKCPAFVFYLSNVLPGRDIKLDIRTL